MLRLALDGGGGQQNVRAPVLLPNRDIKASGKARGDNRPIGGAEGPHSFLLQDTHSHNITQPPYDESYQAADTRHQYPRKPVPKYSSLDTMLEDHVSNTSPGNKGRIDAPVVTGSQSRRPTIPVPSRSSQSKLNTIGDVGPIPRTSLLVPPTLSTIAASPEASPISPSRRSHHKSQPTEPSSSVLQKASLPPPIQKSYSTGSAKRKASEAEVEGDKTPPKVNRATFAPEPRTHRASGTSGSSHGPPSSFNRNKRPRISGSSDSRPTTSSSIGDSPNAKSTGSWSSRGSSIHNFGSINKAPSIIAETTTQPPRRAPSRRSLSQASIPISALVSPHAPSVARSSTFHMRDPRKPAPIQSTLWSLSLPSEVQRGEGRWGWKGWVERGGSPLHAWLFFVGFVVFPLWWAAGFLIPIPRTRTLEGNDTEKGVVLDDPQVEHDAKSWRTRCRIMAIVSIFTYIPFIVLVAIFAR